MGDRIEVVLTADPEATCKDQWRFVLSPLDGGRDYRIDDLEATGKRGCLGHPRTIAALLRGRTIGEIDLEALSDTPCARNESCGKTLAMVVGQLRSQLKMA